ncbi:hypothetical protein FNYG_15955 [Fusarium nygamai]|uniref:Uncharacterized protein n=1 Tax=Gibberella nygamai TaxID=42673 RepID=A0A2K0TYC2_GIBNY|nr:hypothetical protein FNYG_15955 [Fusarium nygamai]
MTAIDQEISLSLDQHSWLEKLHLHLNLPEPAIICALCGYALAANDDRVGRHLGEKHHISKTARQKLNALVNSLKLPSPDILPKRQDGSAPHPNLRIQDGKACKHCGLRSTSSEVLSKHIRSLHKPELAAMRNGGKHWLRDHIYDNLSLQSWTLNDIKSAWIVTEPARVRVAKSRSGDRPLQPAPDSIQHLANQLLDEERKRLELHSSAIEVPEGRVNASSQALLTNWMRRTGWDRTFERADCPILISLSALPKTIPLETVNYLGIHNRQRLSSSATDESRILSIVAALDRLLDQCGETVRFTDVSVRRWLRGRLPDRPYKAPFELVSQAKSERVYRNEFKRCVSFWLRVWRLPPTVSRSILGRSLSKPQQMMLEELWLDSCWDEPNDEVNDTYDTAADVGEEDIDSELEDDIMSEFSEYTSTTSEASETESSSDEEPDLESQRGGAFSPPVFGEDRNCTATRMSSSRETFDSYDRSVDAVLRFFYQAVIEDFEDGMSSSTLLVYFSAVRGLSSEEGNEYLRPARYTPILSRLIYCTRLIFLEAILPRRAHLHAGFAARPRYGQLAALNAIRVNHMCDGTLSPLGEFFSLLAYGMSLQRSEGPAYHFDWSEDGQTISWDGNIQLSMGQFRSLAHEAFRQVTIQCRRLMYGFEPEDPDIRGLRDKLSKTTPGYSFLTDSHNKLEELYLTVFMRACTAPVDGLLKTEQRGSHSDWDIDAAQAYLYGHDACLKTIMVLAQLDSGQGARISELLTLEQANTRSRLRGIGIFGGKIFSITRHHKARLTTNREFQVARFFSSQVATLLYRYLVYIRPTAYAILRRCFEYEPQGALIFTPISKKTRWTTRVFTEELKRLSRNVLGTDVEIGVQLYQQLSIAITERHVRGALPTFDRLNDTTTAADPDVAFAWQSGHRPQQRYTNYGLDGAYPDKLQPSLLRIYAICSERWQDFLSIGSEVPYEGNLTYSARSLISY